MDKTWASFTIAKRSQTLGLHSLSDLTSTTSCTLYLSPRNMGVISTAPASSLAGSDKALLRRSDILSLMPIMIGLLGMSLNGLIVAAVGSRPARISTVPSILLQCVRALSLNVFARRIARSGELPRPYLPLFLLAAIS